MAALNFWDQEVAKANDKITRELRPGFLDGGLEAWN